MVCMWSFVDRMPYTVATILELMRYKTLVPFTVHATLQDTEVGGYFVPSETMVRCNVLTLWFMLY